MVIDKSFARDILLALPRRINFRYIAPGIRIQTPMGILAHFLNVSGLDRKCGKPGLGYERRWSGTWDPKVQGNRYAGELDAIPNFMMSLEARMTLELVVTIYSEAFLIVIGILIKSS